MGATIAAIIAGVLKVVGVIADYLSRQQLIDAGKAEAKADATQKKDDANAQALQVREAVRGDLARNPGRVLDDDGFRRD